MTLSPLAPAATAESLPLAAPSRVAYLDNVKVALTALVIAHHLAISYGAEGSWYYREASEPLTQFVLTLFDAVNQSYFMGLFFFISGYFTPGSVDRKGARRFLLDRLVRLGIPLALFAVLVSPYLEHVGRRTRRGAALGSYVDCMRDFLAHPEFAPGPLWFVQTVLVFSLAYVAVRAARGARASAPPPGRGGGPARAVRSWHLALLALAIGLGSFVTRVAWPAGTEWHHLQLAYFPQYVLLFVAGIVAYRVRALETLTPALGATWGAVAACALAALLAFFRFLGSVERVREVAVGGAHWQALVWIVGESFQCVGLCVAVLVVFRQRLAAQRPLARALAADAYAVYVVHAPIIVALAYALRGMPAPPFARFVATTLLGVPVCFAVGHLLRRVPGAQRVF